MTNRLLNLFFNLFLLLLCILSLTVLLIDSFGFLVDKAFLLWAAAACFLLWLAVNVKHGLLPGLLFSALFLFGAYRRFASDVKLELSDFFDKLTGVYYEHYYSASGNYSFSNAVDSHSFILLLAVFLLAAYISMSLTSKSGRTSFSLLGSLPVFAGCIAVNGRPPVLCIVCLQIFWILLLAGGNFYTPDGNQGRILLLITLPVSVALCAVILWQKPAEYNYERESTDIMESFDRFGAAVSRWMNGKDGGLDLFPDIGAEDSDDTDSSLDSSKSLISFPNSSWGLGDGELDLNRSYDGVDTERVILRARAETDGYIYLRSFSYGDYTGTGWLLSENPDSGISSLTFTAEAISAGTADARHSMALRFSSASDVTCTPYYSFLTSEDDGFIRSNGDRDYTVSYCSFSGDYTQLRLPAEYAELEASYRSYAHSTYTKLPEATKSAVLSIAQQAGLDQASDVIAAVAGFVQNHASYDINTQPYPADDYAVYFFQQAETGYCIHFATAAAVMYRALGIPARVTDGFLFNGKAGEYVDISQGNEHAWVEVYWDGLGWIPVEVTGSAGFAYDPSEEAAAPLPTASPEESAGPETPEESSHGSWEEEPSVLSTPQPTQILPVGIINTQQETENSAIPRIWTRLSGPLSYMALLLLLFCALPASRFFRLRLMERRIAQRDRRKAAVWIWKYASRASRFGADIPEDITKCAEKAAFSPNPIGEAEHNESREALYAMIDRSYSQISPVRKFLLKYISALL